MIQKIKHFILHLNFGKYKNLILETLWIYQYAKLYWKQIIFYTLLGLVGTAVSLLSSLISRDMVDIITGHQTGLLFKTFSIFIGLAVGNIVLSQLSGYFSSKISISVDNSIKADIFDKMLVTDLESLQTYHTGDLLTRWSTDASTISSGILNWIPNLIIYCVRFISAFIMVFYHDPWFALIALVGMPISLLTTRHMLKQMRNSNKSVAAMNAKMTGFNQETFSNIQTIKAFDMIKLYSRQLRNMQSEYLGMRMTFQRFSMGASIIMAIAGLIISYSCYGFGIYRVWSGAISYGTMTMFLSLSSTLTSTLNQLIALIPTAVGITVSAKRLMDIMNMPKENYDLVPEVDAFWRKNRSAGLTIRISDLTFGYKGHGNVFVHTDLEAHPHEIVALVGPSGEGKTTMLRLILSLLCPRAGHIELTGDSSADTLALSPSARKLFAYVPQGNTMFSGTIAENMRGVKEDATDDEIIASLQTACAWEFVQKLPDGINYKLGERGKGLSEGQSQRLSIARALLRHSPILLLDEATSALDVATERQLLRNIIQDDSPRTCIVTTHRPTVLTICNRVYGIRDKQCVALSCDEIQQLIREF